MVTGGIMIFMQAEIKTQHGVATSECMHEEDTGPRRCVLEKGTQLCDQNEFLEWKVGNLKPSSFLSTCLINQSLSIIDGKWKLSYKLISKPSVESIFTLAPSFHIVQTGINTSFQYSTNLAKLFLRATLEGAALEFNRFLHYWTTIGDMYNRYYAR